MNKRLGFALVSCVLAIFACGGNHAELVVPPESDGGPVVRDSGGGRDGSGGSGGLITLPDVSTGGIDMPDSSSCGAFGCPETGPRCGNAVLEDVEQCDDGNTVAGDGCDGLCRKEPNFDCPTPGQPCVSTIVCGDGMLGGLETCDDGNMAGGDGCSSSCLVEPGFACTTPGSPCTPAVVARCGDGAVNAGEFCDDGGRADGDGCSSTCQVEAGWRCPQPGQPCIRNDYCGDGRLKSDGSEACDDGNTSPGDGCDGVCHVEPNFRCPTPGQPCTSTIICGDSRVTGDEACDDGNTIAGDGCSADCKLVEPGFTCPRAAGVGGSCVAVPPNVCGDARISYGEFCDDGNTTDNDGCSHLCRVEAGFDCPVAGQACRRIAVCGDGVVTQPEACDDHNAVGGDGCSVQCTVEPNFVCPAAGAPCVSTVRCGDRVISGAETCDDGNTVAGDGCSASCAVEAGWRCPVIGAPCIAIRCGDGLLARGVEQCDDGNTTNGDGCTSTCTLEGPPNGETNGWQCLTPGMPCTRTNCGNGIVEGSEQCDDGNNRPFDGCAWNCTKEPSCGYPATGTGPYSCTAVCGDGMLFPGEECDDGNILDGDGCSHDCLTEAGYTCTPQRPAPPDPLFLPIVYRDFTPVDQPGGVTGHPQFEVDPIDGRRQPNIALLNLDRATLKPQYNPAYIGLDAAGASRGRPWTMDGPARNTTGTAITPAQGAAFFTRGSGNAASLTTAAQIAARYTQWYTDVTGTNQQFQDLLSLGLIAAGTYQYDRSSSNLTPLLASFFPLDGRGFGNVTFGTAPNTTSHNFHFTSEVRYWFEYQGGEQLEFRGDDDVWVFVNGQLSVDLGGIHGELRGVVTLNGAASQVCADDFVCTANCDSTATIPNCTTQSFNLVAGNIYEIAVFQAERHITQSNYKLTLRGFNVPRSVCAPICGDGIVVGREVCDLGTARNTGAYGTCNPDCTLPARCGDAVVQMPPEQCDNGINQATYTPTPQCGPNCQLDRYCGDAIVSNGEQCDNGTASNTGAYGACKADCTLGPRCGDGTASDGELCDDGVNNGTSNSLCRADCRLKCGDGTLDPGEQCDNGAASNTGAYGGCKVDCTLGPRCGDGIRNGTEQCDDGRNDGSYGTCAPTCVFGPRCGDGVIQSTAGEICDQGIANAANAYGPNRCLPSCLPAPYCGDKEVDVANGEVCDDGVNSGQPGSCRPDCSGFVPLPSCGDQIRQDPEQCDDGVMRNGMADSTCDLHCKFKCGNGFRDPGEACDDGVNNGSYGTCLPNCMLADHCGDGVVNGSEECDRGTMNLPNPYGPNQCTTACTLGPFCGDGRIQSQFGEECDGSPGCDQTCKFSIIR